MPSDSLGGPSSANSSVLLTATAGTSGTAPCTAAMQPPGMYRPEELRMRQPMDNMGLLARPASLHLQELNRAITNLSKIGQGAGAPAVREDGQYRYHTVWL